MGIKTNKHEEIIKMIYLLDLWRLRPPTEDETNALTAAAKEKYPDVVQTVSKITDKLEYKSRLIFLMKFNSKVQTLTFAITIFWAVVYFAYVGNVVTSGPLLSLIQNPLFVITVFILLVTFASFMYLFRVDSLAYRVDNTDELNGIKNLIENLVYSLNHLALNRIFEPNKYPFKLNFDDYKGLRLLGRSGRSTYQSMFSLSHSLMSKAKTVKIMSSMGRLSFFQGLRGFKGGQPAIKLVNSELASGAKDYLKSAADWRNQGVDILVRKAPAGTIKKSYLILDDKEIWVAPYLLEELDSKESLEDFIFLKDKIKKDEILERFNKIWETSQKSDELEEISWREHFKQKAEIERKRKQET